MLFSKNGNAISARGLSEENHAPEAFLGTQADAVLEAMRASETGAVRSEIGGDPVYILFAPVATTQWKLTVVMPVGEILAPATSSNAAIDGIIREARADMGNIIGNLNLIMIGAFAALAAAFITIVWSACGRISRPILKLSEDVRQIGEGNLEYHPDIRTGDEIELLSLNFERMTASLRAYIANLTRVTAEKERIGAELGVATRIQASMLPCIFPPFPDRPEFDIYATMTPAKEVGGDFYDFFMVDDDHLAVVIADVSGKGIPAALFMMTAKTLIKTLAQTGLSPAQVFTEANARLSENNEAGMFVTAWMGVLEISTGRFVYVNAGHNPPLFRRAGENFQFLKSRPAFVLAGMEGIRYRHEEALLSPGDVLYIYTDGVTEATDPEEHLYGDERLCEVLNKESTQELATILRAVKKDVDAFAAGAPQFDDITMLALRFDKRGE
jgi:sigma-B regulation protein RsbU (phosphoserine phosphatase)